MESTENSAKMLNVIIDCSTTLLQSSAVWRGAGSFSGCRAGAFEMQELPKSGSGVITG
jgi:hypothetical protein